MLNYYFYTGELYLFIIYFIVLFLLTKKYYILYINLFYIVEFIILKYVINENYKIGLSIFIFLILVCLILKNKCRYKINEKREKGIAIVLAFLTMFSLLFSLRDTLFLKISIFLHLVNVLKSKYFEKNRELIIL